MGMSQPDWNRVGVVPPDHHLSALGDATRWGATIVQNIRGAANIAEFPGQVVSTDQILSVACRDAFSRAWSVMGTVSAPLEAWALPDGVGPGQFASALAVTAGVGQATITHVFNLRATINAIAPFYYSSDFAGLAPPATAAPPALTRPFIIAGAVCGGKINARLITSYFFDPLSPGPFPPSTFVTTLTLTPFSPGVEAPNK